MQKLLVLTLVLAVALALPVMAWMPDEPASPAAPAEAWERVADAGVGNPNNEDILAMRVFGNYLYASTWNPSGDGASILRSPDGETWTAVVSDGFGDTNNYGIYGLAEYDGNLYASTRNPVGPGRAELWTSGSGDPGSWTEVPNSGLGATQQGYWSLLTYQNRLWAGCSTGATEAELWSYNSGTNNWTREEIPGFDPNNYRVNSLAEFDGDLYVGTANNILGAEVWRRDGSSLTWEKVAQNGFGNPNNTRAYTMRAYKDVLYVGTFNATDGAELYATNDGYAWEQIFAAGFDDPNNQAVWNLLESDGYLYLSTQNTALGARIYRTTDGHAWTPVSLGGFDGADNQWVWGMAVFEGPSGLHLYAGTDNPANGAEIWRTALPQPEESWEQVEWAGFDGDAANFVILDYAVYEDALYAAVANFNGTQVWRTTEGRTWVQVDIDGFGDPNNTGGYALTVHDGELYLGTANASGAGVYRLRDNGVEWEQVNNPGFGDVNNDAVYALASFNGSLYAGTWNSFDRAEVWRYSGSGTSWVNQSPDDDDLEADNDWIRTMVVYNGYLYIGTYSINGGEIWRSQDGAVWAAVDTDGQGDSNNDQLLAMYPFDGYLYAGYSNGVTGGQIWRSQDGMSGWTQVNQAGFGRNLVDDPSNSRVLAMADWDGYLYASTENNATGGEVWRTAVGASQSDWEQVNTDGFSFQLNRGVWALEAFGPHLYAGTYNATEGAEVWRTGRPDTGPDDPCCEVVKVGIEVVGAGWILVNGDQTTPIRAPHPGIYDVPLKGAGTYEITVEYVEGNQPHVQPITVVVGTDGTVQITHGTATQLMAPLSPQEAWTQMADAGVGDPNNLIVMAMTPFNNYLYASTQNAGGTSILRSPDGQTWNAVASGGFGDAGNIASWDMVEYDGYLYAGTSHTTQAEMWRSQTGASGSWTQLANSGLGAQQRAYLSLLAYNDPIVGHEVLWTGCGTDGTATAELWMYDDVVTGNWTREIIPGFDVDMDANGFGDNTHIYSLVAFQGDLYVGTLNLVTGAELWRRDGTSGAWTKVAQNGFGAPGNYVIYGTAVYNDALYVGTVNAAGAELYASRDGDSWEQVFAGGFDNPANIAIWGLIESNGYLYLGTQNASGGRVYRTVDGDFWTPASSFGFGDASNFQVRGMATFQGLGGTSYLYVGTGNANGAEIWRTVVPQPEEIWEQVERQGIDDPGNNTIWSMVEHDGAVYVGTYNGITGGQVWKSVDGRTWVQVGPDGLDGTAGNTYVDALGVHDGELYAGVDGPTGARVYHWIEASATWEQINNDGFGTVNNQSALALASFNGGLYASTYNSTDQAMVFRYTGTGTNWTNFSPGIEDNNDWIDAMTVYGSHLYIGTAGGAGAGEIWRYDGTNPWESITTDGFGDSDNQEAMALLEFDGYLYAGFENPADGGEVWRSQDGMSGWQQVNTDGFGRSVADSNNYAIRSFAVWQGYLYAGTNNGVTGGEVWRTDTGASQDDWEQVNSDGFGSGNSNSQIMTLLGYGDHLYAGTANFVSGAEIWRTGLPGVPGGRFAQAVNVSLRTDQATTIDVTGAMTWSYDAPARGLYAIPLPGAGIYNISCGCGQDLDVYVDTSVGPQLDHFTFNTIADQYIDTPFSITINARDDSSPSQPVVISATVTLTDSTGTISPTTAVFANQSSASLNVTIGVTATNVVITATYNTITGTSNAFDVTEPPELQSIYLPIVVRD